MEGQIDARFKFHYAQAVLFNIPNLITLSRILVIPLLAFLLHLAEGAPVLVDQKLSFWAMILFAAAGFSDLVDGYYARKYGQVSVMGKFFDPMADKLIHMTALVFMIPLERISVWVVAALLFREIFITGLRSMAIGEGIVIEAAAWGKRKTAWLNVGFAALIAHYPFFAGHWFELNVRAIGIFCVGIGFLYAMASGVQYTVVFFNDLRKRSL